MEPRRKPGPRPKGARKAFTVRAPEDHHKIYEDAYKQAGYTSLSDYVAVLLADHHGLAVPPYVERPGPIHQQPELLKAG